MKYLTKLTLISLLAICSSLACEITGPKLIIKEDGKSSPLHLFELLKCTDKQKTQFTTFLSDFQGTLNKRVLTAELGLGFKKKSTTEIQTLSSFFNSRINKDNSWKFVESSFSGTNIPFVAISENQSLSVLCNNCNNTGNKNIKIEIRDPIAARVRSSWSNTKLAARTKALYTTENVPVNNKALLPHQFEERVVYDIRPEQFFTDKEQLVFYKTNRAKSKGEAVRFQDLTPVNLVKMGHPATIILKNNSLTLETIAIPSQSGKLGQRIRLKNPRTKKVIIGKVVNFNKVEVEL